MNKYRRKDFKSRLLCGILSAAISIVSGMGGAYAAAEANILSAAKQADAAEVADVILRNSDSTSIVPNTVNLSAGLKTIKVDGLNISDYANGKCYLWDSISGMHPKCAPTTLK